MFKAIKYFVLAALYKKAKKSLTMLFIYVVLLLLSSFIMNDLMDISTGVTVYMLFLIKWILILSLLGLIVSSVLKIFNIATNPFEEKGNTPADTKRDRILCKEKLLTECDLIINKYLKD